MRRGQGLMLPSESFCREKHRVKRTHWWEGSDGLAQATLCCCALAFLLLSTLCQWWDPTPPAALARALPAPCQLQLFLHSSAATGGTGASPVTRESLNNARSNCTKLDHVPQNQICLVNPLIDFKALLRLKNY